jgi:hypothetical protein
MNNTSIDSLKKFMSDFPADFEKRIKEIRELPFIKNVDVIPEGIKIDYGETYIEFNKRNYYIGNIYVVLTPDEIKVYNTDNCKEGYPHPHATEDHKPCFGNTSTEVYKLLFDMNFKKLAFMISQYLKTYSPTGVPYQNISNWRDSIVKEDKDVKEMANPILPATGVQNENQHN